MRTDNTTTQGNSNNIVVFSFERHEVRGFEYQGEPHFIGNEVAAALGYASPAHAVSQHCKALKLLKMGELPFLKIPPRGMNVIPERDVYRLVMRSNLPTAEAFEEKVVGEILPAIRRTGSYSVTPKHEIPQTLHEALRLAADTEERRIVAEAKVTALEPKAEALDLLAAKPGELGVRDAGRELHVGQKWVTDYIDGHGWSCIEGGKRKPAHYGLKHGYCRLVPENYRHPHTGEERVREEFRLTRRGVVRLAEIIAKLRKENGLTPFAQTPAQTA